MFKDQQTKFRAMIEGAKSIPVPLDGDAAAVSKFQAAYEALLKKARRAAPCPAGRVRAAGLVFNRSCQP